MKDEIKEIINDLQRVVDRKCYPEDILDGSIAQEWVDCITNLQEELKSANESITWWQNRFNTKNDGFKSTVEELCETTEKFEKLQEKYEEADNDRHKLFEQKEKAIEYIKSLCYIESKNEWFTYGDDLSPEHIVNILNGGGVNER